MIHTFFCPQMQEDCIKIHVKKSKKVPSVPFTTNPSSCEFTTTSLVILSILLKRIKKKKKKIYMPPRKTKIFMWGEPKYLQRALVFTILIPFHLAFNIKKYCGPSKSFTLSQLLQQCNLAVQVKPLFVFGQVFIKKYEHMSQLYSICRFKFMSKSCTK